MGWGYHSVPMASVGSTKKGKNEWYQNLSDEPNKLFWVLGCWWVMSFE